MSHLTVKILKVTLGAGTSMKSGAPKPYSFATVTYLVPAEDFSNESHNIQSAGFEPKEIDLVFDQAMFEKFKKGAKFLCDIDLVLSPNPKNASRSMVTDFKLIN